MLMEKYNQGFFTITDKSLLSPGKRAPEQVNASWPQTSRRLNTSYIVSPAGKGGVFLKVNIMERNSTDFKVSK
jgi:hypothetical protein